MARRNSREAILRTAEELFLSRRFDKVTLEDVRKRAKVGKGTIYLYYKDKEDLYGQVLLSGVDHLHDLITAQAGGEVPPDEKLRAIARQLREFHQRRQNLFRMLQAEDCRRALRDRGLHEQLRRRHDDLLRLIASVVNQGMKTGIYRNDLPAPAVARVFLAAVRAGSAPRHQCAGPAVSLERILSLFFDGVRSKKG